MNQNIHAFFAVICGLLLFGCSSDDGSGTPTEQPITVVHKMTVKNFDGALTPQLTAVFDFTYDEARQVASVQKALSSETGDVVENSTYVYNYFNQKITSYGISGQTMLSVLYNSQSRIQNLGFGSDLDYNADGTIHQDSYGTEFVYINGNPTGTVAQPNLYGYDTKRNPFAEQNAFFRIIFEEQFEPYHSVQFFRSANNVVSENNGQTQEILYSTSNQPTKITTKNSEGAILEEIDFEYIEI